MIVAVRHGRILCEFAAVEDLAQKDGVGGRIHRGDDLAGEPRDAAVGHGELAAHGVRSLSEFIELLGRAKAESADEGGIDALAEDGEREVAALLDRLVRIVVLVDADGDGRRLRRDLHRAVGDAADRLAFVPARAEIHAVRKIVKCSLIHDFLPYDLLILVDMRDGVLSRVIGLNNPSVLPPR